MKAAVYTKTKLGKVLQIMDVQPPIPRDNELLIKVRAASVNPADWRLKSRRPGVDAAGEVQAVGKGITRFTPGEEVFGACKGAFAEYACACERALAPTPNKLTFEEAASVPIAALTALQALRDKGNLQPGQKVLINGASGGVGTFAVQIAKWLGADVTGVCSTRNIEMVRSLGADRVIDYSRDDFTEQKQRYDLLLDNVGNRPLSACRQVLTAHGKYVMVGAPKELGAALIRMLQALAVYPFWRRRLAFFIANVNADDLRTLCEIITSGKVTPVIDKRYPLSAAADAIAYVEGGHARAKVIIAFE